MSERSESYRAPADFAEGEFEIGEVITGSISGRSAHVVAPRGYVLVHRWILWTLSALACGGAVLLGIAIGFLSIWH